MAIRQFIPGEDVEKFLVELSKELAAVRPTTETFVAPSLTSTERSAITPPVSGMLVNNTTTGRLENYTTSWLAQVLAADTLYIGTTAVPLNRASGSLTLAGLVLTDTLYIGTTGIALNRASGSLTLAGLVLTTPNIGAATGASVAVSGNLSSSAGGVQVATSILSSGGGIGYSAGAGGTVTQGTSRTTTVTNDNLCGNITMYSAAQAADALVTFTLSNTYIDSTDYLAVQHISATNGGAWCFSTVCASNSATISIRNVSAASITSATPLRFTLIKGVTT